MVCHRELRVCVWRRVWISAGYRIRVMQKHKSLLEGRLEYWE